MFTLWKSNCLRVILVLAITVTAHSIASAQVVYDWSSDSKAPESYPKITRKQKVTFTIKNVNNILYTYRLQVTQDPIDSDDFKHIATLFKHFIPARTQTFASDPCPGLENKLLSTLKQAVEDITKDKKLPLGYADTSPHVKVTLDESIKAWDSHGAIIRKALVEEEAFIKNQCTASQELANELTDFKETVDRIDRLVHSEHVFVDEHVLTPGNNVSVTVFELFNHETISTKTFTFPGTDILTLSAGALFSQIPDRAYEARKTPLATENVLTVEGNSRATPSLIALLNYSLGGLKLDWDHAGVAISAGPVIRLGGKSEASSFGFFTGLSGHLAHRFYITPGLHFGQFSDFPVGFADGSSVPANFGTLIPVKRWTARFGLAITFKTKDFSGLVTSETPKVTGDEAGGSETKPKEKPAPAGDNPESISESIRRSFLRTANTESEPPLSERAPEEREPRRDTEHRTQRQPRSSARSPRESSPLLRIRGISSSMSSADERVSISSEGPIHDYVMSFKGERFYLVVPDAQLDVIQNTLRGSLFSEPEIERRGGDLVVSLLLLPGTRVSVLERPDGLDLVLFSPRD